MHITQYVTWLLPCSMSLETGSPSARCNDRDVHGYDTALVAPSSECFAYSLQHVIWKTAAAGKKQNISLSRFENDMMQGRLEAKYVASSMRWLLSK